MRKYYLFVLKKEYYNFYKNKSYVLYKMLENLYNLKPYDFSYGMSIYKEMYLPFSYKVLKNYINNKFDNKKISKKVIKIRDNNEISYIQLGYAKTIIKTNANVPKIFKTFNIYNKNIFVCDFQCNDYFWLNSCFSSTYKK